jgi:ComF family protein
VRLYQWQKAAASIFFPQRICLNCGQLSLERPLCPVCSGIMKTLRHCPQCASFIADTETKHYLCPDCRRQAPSFMKGVAALPYTGSLRDVLIAYKYEQKTGYRRPLAALLVALYENYYLDIAFDAIVPVPLYPERLRERGYNQAELLSRLVAEETNLPHRPTLLTRVGGTPPLADLGRKERMKVLQGVFKAPPEAAGLHLLLVDDIYTTGATAEMCSRALLKQKAASIHYLAVAAGWALP